jgi:hypothetical protein
MKSSRRFKTLTLLLAAIAWQQIQTANAVVTSLTVDGRSGPWAYSPGGLNTAFQYGVNNHIAPTVIPGLSQDWTITLSYQSGTVVGAPGNPGLDANGDPGSPNPAGPGNIFGAVPGYFAPHTTYAIQLIGVFTDSSGQLVGLPFALGNGPFNLGVPAGASRLQLGVNDNFFADNSGSWTLNVEVVPEPGALAFVGLGAIICGWQRARKARLNAER